MEGEEYEPSGGNESLTALLTRWQSGDLDNCFEVISKRATPIAKQAAGPVLRKRGVLDPLAVDEAVSLALTHIWSLRDRQGGVTAFRLGQEGENTAEVYVRWLAVRRAMDVARRIRRRARKEIPLSSAEAEPVLASSPEEPEASREGLLARFHDCVGLLDTRPHLLLKRLLDGASQKDIAYEMGVCEGTVSRMRAKAVETMRRLVQKGDR